MNSIINNGYALVKTVAESPLLKQGLSQADKVLKVFLNQSATFIHTSARWADTVVKQGYTAVKKMSAFHKAVVVATALGLVVGAALIRKAVRSVKIPSAGELALIALLSTLSKKDLEE